VSTIDRNAEQNLALTDNLGEIQDIHIFSPNSCYSCDNRLTEKEGIFKLSTDTLRLSNAFVLKVMYTGCPRRNVPDFGRVFLMLKYTDITQNTYIQS